MAVGDIRRTSQGGRTPRPAPAETRTFRPATRTGVGRTSWAAFATTSRPPNAKGNANRHAGLVRVSQIFPLRRGGQTRRTVRVAFQGPPSRFSASPPSASNDQAGVRHDCNPPSSTTSDSACLMLEPEARSNSDPPGRVRGTRGRRMLGLRGRGLLRSDDHSRTVQRP